MAARSPACAQVWMRAGVPGWSCSTCSYSVCARSGAQPGRRVLGPVGLRQDGGIGEEGHARAVGELADHRAGARRRCSARRRPPRCPRRPDAAAFRRRPRCPSRGNGCRRRRCTSKPARASAAAQAGCAITAWRAWGRRVPRVAKLVSSWPNTSSALVQRRGGSGEAARPDARGRARDHRWPARCRSSCAATGAGSPGQLPARAPQARSSAGGV